MAWPNTPLTTYIANMVPAIKAFDLNSFQTGINGIINGTYSLKSLTLDGTGGATIAPNPGELIVSRSVVDTVLVNPTVQRGAINVGQFFSGVALIASGGTLIRGINVQAVTRAAMGKYVITWNIRLDSDGTGNFFAFSTPRSVSSLTSECVPISATPSQVEVYIFDKDGNATDSSFFVGVIGA